MEGWWVPGRARGWAELALDDVLGADGLSVEPARPGSPGAFMANLRQAAGTQADAACHALVKALGSRDDIAQAVAKPPMAFVTPRPEFLHEAVAKSIVTHGPLPPHPGRPPNLAFTYSDPNMNKPLHLGHYRNIVIGMSVTRLLEAQGSTVDEQALHSDWGIHIAQAVLGYLKWGEGATPESTGIKSDHLVGRFYARFHQENAPFKDAAGDEPTALDKEAAALLQRMADGDPEASNANALVTGWVEAGVAATYHRLDCHFDHIWRERKTTELGVAAVHRAVKRGRCITRDDTSVYLDLSDRGLSPVTLLRNDGTPVVHVQWLGVDLARYPGSPYDHILQMSGQEWAPGEIVYTEVARELGGDWIDKWTHFYYGMVTLAGGKMSSRISGSTILIDELLDDLAAWFGRHHDDPAACELAAQALTRFHFLAPKRLKDVVYDHDVLVDATRRLLATVLAALAKADDRRDAPTAGTEELLLQLNAFPRLAQTAAQRLEPEYVVSYLVDVAEAVERCVATEGLGGTVASATSTVMRTSFGLLAIDLPERLSTLPAALLDPTAAAST